MIMRADDKDNDADDGAQREVFKVQLSLYSTHKTQRMLIYNESRTLEYEGEAAEEIIALMPGKNKAYFNGYFKDGLIHLDPIPNLTADF